MAVVGIAGENCDLYEVIYCGLITTGRDEKGAPRFYFRTAPKFEAPQDSPYDWLNNAIFVCMPGYATDCICLHVWKVL